MSFMGLYESVIGLFSKGKVKGTLVKPVVYSQPSSMPGENIQQKDVNSGRLEGKVSKLNGDVIEVTLTKPYGFRSSHDSAGTGRALSNIELPTNSHAYSVGQTVRVSVDTVRKYISKGLKVDPNYGILPETKIEISEAASVSKSDTDLIPLTSG